MKLNRWNKAQKYEKDWWLSRKDDVDLSFYETFSIELLEDIEGVIKIENGTQILEIGSGAAGIITFLKDSEYRYAIDPLEDTYASVKHFLEYRDKNVNYFNGIGEELPFEDNKFDFIIIDNVLDHCEDPDKVFSEMKRTIKNNGIIYFRQNTYTCWGKFVRSMMEKFEIDKGHPFTFTKKGLKDSFKKYNFDILKFKRGGYFKTWLKEFLSFTKHGLVKACLLVNRDRTLYILKVNKDN